MPEVVSGLLASAPVAWALPLSFLCFLLLLALVWTIPASVVRRGAPDEARWRDLRIWATALVLLQLGIYVAFA